MSVGTLNSSQKVTYSVNVTNLIADSGNKLSARMSDLETLTKTAQYEAMDRIFNAFSTTGNEFMNLCKTNLSTIHELLDILKSDKAIGEAFTSKVRSAINAVEAAQSRQIVFDEVHATRDGQEVWDEKMQGNVSEALLAIIGVRKEYILELSRFSKGMDDPQFTTVIQKIGKANEAFTNSWVHMYNGIKNDLQTLGIMIDKQFEDAEAAAMQVGKVGSATEKFNITGMQA